MIFGVGIDVSEIKRIKKSLERYGTRFENRIFTKGEQEYCRARKNFEESFAARFAAKEAFLKALGIGHSRGVKWTEVYVEREPGGPPLIKYEGRAAEIAKEKGVIGGHLSLTHDGGNAQAIVILEKE